ncbi:MAG: SAM-dependent methyltransferase, partial [Cycloclasticus sp.]
NESVNHVFNCIPHVLNEQGYFIIQTIHPINGCGHVKYQDGWRKGTWAGFNQQFTNPPPWYFRTLETWKALFKLNKLELIEILEPVNSHIKEAVSIIFISQLAANK